MHRMLGENKREGSTLMAKVLTRATERKELQFIGLETITRRTGLGEKLRVGF